MRPKKTKEPLPKSTYTAQRIEAVAFRVKELPHLTFYGKTFSEAKRNMLSELTRHSPQGFDLEFTAFADRVLDKTLEALKDSQETQKSRH